MNGNLSFYLPGQLSILQNDDYISIIVRNMCPKDCEQFLKNNLNKIAEIFKSNIKQDADKIISCFYSCFKDAFIKWTLVMYNRYPEDFINFISDISFTDGILKFTEKAAAGDIYDSNTTIKTVLFSFYRNKILENLQKEKRLLEKNKKYTPAYKEETLEKDNEEYALREKRYSILELALAKMEPTDRQIIIWRHLEEKSCDEIADLLAINKESATNRIYRCMQRLRSLTENSDKQNGYKR
jgi:RNA polymerase sigma factor (sigma-70 family)